MKYGAVMGDSPVERPDDDWSATVVLKRWLSLDGRIRYEPSVLVVLLVISAAIWGFSFIAEISLEGHARSFDEAVLLSMRNPVDPDDPRGPGWVEEMGRDFTALGSTAVLGLMTTVVATYLLLISKRRIALILLIVVLGAVVTSHALKHAIDRPRPDLVSPGSVVYTKSFPSGHSMHAAATYLTLAALLACAHRRRRIGVFVIGVGVFTTVLVGVSRVYLGLHWPTDVVAGWMAGAAWALMGWLLVRWTQRHGEVESGERDDESGNRGQAL